MGTLDLLRPEIRQLAAYRPADQVAGLVRLNANENPWEPARTPATGGLNRYPDARPTELGRRLAALYGVAETQLLVTRGSSEAIDVVIRGFCAAGDSEIILSPPTFGMYEVYGRIQGTSIRLVPLDRARNFQLDVQRILTEWQAQTRLVFVCSPNNPTGSVVPASEIRRLCSGLAGRGVVVLDAAYAEFTEQDESVALLAEFDNLVVLRTLSKAFGLAGVRCGALLARPELVDLLGRTLPPYCFPVTSQAAVLQVLDQAAERCAAQIETLKSERRRMTQALAGHRHVRTLWPSEANFLLAEVDDAAAFIAAARNGGVLVRDFSMDQWTPGCVRITVGTPAENDQLLKAIA